MFNGKGKINMNGRDSRQRNNTSSSTGGLFSNDNHSVARRRSKKRAIIFAVVFVALVILLIVAGVIYVGVNHESDDATDINNSSQGFPTSIDKPIIYLHPESDTNITVKLGKPEDITVSYPAYNASTGWRVLAKSSGELVDLQTGRNLYALYYESDLSNAGFGVEDDGFVVKREDVASFLEDKLAKLGLNEREAEEFIVYWLPRLSEHEYNYIRFATTDEINQAMPLDINPTPDTTIRVLMTYKGLDEPLAGVKEQQLPDTPTRTGFTAVEWGGSEIVN